MTLVWATHAQVVFNYYLQFKQAENTQIQPALFLDKIVSFMDIYSMCPVLQNSIFLHLICNINCFQPTLIQCVTGILPAFCVSQAADQYSATPRKKKITRILLKRQTPGGINLMHRQHSIWMHMQIAAFKQIKVAFFPIRGFKEPYRQGLCIYILKQISLTSKN